MKKSDLKNYMIVETRQGYRYMVLENRACRATSYIELENYNENLTEITFRILDIVKVYKLNSYNNLPTTLDKCFIDNNLTLIWEEKPKIKVTEDEKAILRSLNYEYKYIIRDECGELFVYKNKPYKNTHIWGGNNYNGFSLFNHLFNMVKWEDKEPTLIADLLKEGE